MLRQILKISPNRADCLLRLIKYEDEALIVERLRKVIDLEPTWIAAREELCSHFIQKGNLEEAERELAQILEVVEKIEKKEIVIPPLTSPVEEYYEKEVTKRCARIRDIYNGLADQIERVRNSQLR